jgi:hypothetical protein
MTARSTPYPPAGAHVRIPELVWAAALHEVRRYAELGIHDRRRGSEGLVYLAGLTTADELIVTSLLRLNHAPQGDRVQPTPAEIRWLLSTLRERDEKLIAQLHTHRHGAHHSPGDDLMATSFHEGFLSIVVPNFAVGVERMDECIVHEYHSGTFRPLSAEQTAARLTVYPQIVDPIVGPRHEATEEPNRWRRFAKRLRSIAPKRR